MLGSFGEEEQEQGAFRPQQGNQGGPGLAWGPVTCLAGAAKNTRFRDLGRKALGFLPVRGLYLIAQVLWLGGLGLAI